MRAAVAERLPGLLGHELRNPLASAVTGALLLREMTDGDDPRTALLDAVLRDLDRMTALTDGWLQLARGGRVDRARIRVADLLGEVAARHGAQIVVCPSDCEVDGNRSLLGRVLDNLCENSRQAGASTIRLAVQSLGDGVVLHVEDDGAGVAAADIDDIFKPGWSKRGSAGLGLHGVMTTVAAHGGSIRCVPLARGTRFTIVLPEARERAASA